jgi:hypothetical protein
VSEHQTSFRSRGKQLQEREVLENVYENEALSQPIRSNDLEVSERAVRILKTIQGVRGNPEAVAEVYQRARVRQMTMNVMEYKLHIKRETIRQIVLEGWGKRQIRMKFAPPPPLFSRTRSSAVIVNRCVRMTAWRTSDTNLVHLTSRLPTFFCSLK